MVAFDYIGVASPLSVAVRLQLGDHGVDAVNSIDGFTRKFGMVYPSFLAIDAID
jgi:hypothetical protein